MTYSTLQLLLYVLFVVPAWIKVVQLDKEFRNTKPRYYFDVSPAVFPLIGIMYATPMILISWITYVQPSIVGQMNFQFAYWMNVSYLAGTVFLWNDVRKHWKRNK